MEVIRWPYFINLYRAIENHASQESLILEESEQTQGLCDLIGIIKLVDSGMS